MARLHAVLTEQDLTRNRGAGKGLNLDAYLDMLDTVIEQGGVGGVVTLDRDESARTEKGRLTRAAKQRGKQVVWRLSPLGELRFVLADPGGPVPGARTRRSRAEVDADQITIDAIMTEDVADITETHAAKEASGEPQLDTDGGGEETEVAVAPAPRRRGRKA